MNSIRDIKLVYMYIQYRFKFDSIEASLEPTYLKIYVKILTYPNLNNEEIKTERINTFTMRV